MKRILILLQFNEGCDAVQMVFQIVAHGRDLVLRLFHTLVIIFLMLQKLGRHQTPLAGLVDHLGLVDQIEQREGRTHENPGFR